METVFCLDCGEPLSGKVHIPKACIGILKWKLSEAERELRVAQGTVEWLRKNQEKVKAS